MNIVHVYKSALLQTIIARLTIEIGEGNKESWEKLQLSIVIQQSDKSSHFIFFFIVAGPKKMWEKPVTTTVSRSH